MSAEPETGPRRLRVALTGGIGSGKSSAADLFAGLGATVSDADLISHALTGPGGSALPAIAAAFGRDVIDAHGALDRAAMRALVFADTRARQRLEAILHPLIRARMRLEADAGTGPYVILAIPLLFETGQRDMVERVLVIDCPESMQVARVMARSGLPESEVRRIIASQVPREQRLAGADDVIDNSGPAAALRPQVERLHRVYTGQA